MYRKMECPLPSAFIESQQAYKISAAGAVVVMVKSLLQNAVKYSVGCTKAAWTLFAANLYFLSSAIQNVSERATGVARKKGLLSKIRESEKNDFNIGFEAVHQCHELRCCNGKNKKRGSRGAARAKW